MMEKTFSARAADALRRAQDAAGTLGHDAVGSEHLLLAVACGDGAAGGVLSEFGVTGETVRALIVRACGRGVEGDAPVRGLRGEARRALEFAADEARRAGSAVLDEEHLLLGMLRGESAAMRVLTAAGVDGREIYGRLRRRMDEAQRPAPPAREPKRLTRRGEEAERGRGLAEFTRDLTALARAGGIDPVIGRENEIARTIQILSRRTKNNPCLIGEPGVGKTAVAEGLAQRIARGEAPEELLGQRILSLDLTGMVAGTKYRGEFEERVGRLVGEIVRAGDVILFIDEVHNLVGAGSAEGAIDAANILKPALSRGEIRVIGATTVDEYRRSIEKDAALERRFQPVVVGEPDEAAALEILRGLRPRYEAHHGLRITDGALAAAVRLSRRYIADRRLPDKAIDLMDEAASRVRLSARRTDGESAVTEEDVAAAVALWTGIPAAHLSEDEGRRLLRLEQTLHERVVGQEEAVSAVARSIRRGRAGVRDPGRPIGSFLFLGPTGVGKTELCRTLSETLFGSESAMIRIDMSEYTERHTVSRLIGAPPGYVGHDEGGQLTERVRRRPYAVVLFDEIEKAHEDVWNVLLQILEDGVVTDGRGRRVDFTNAVVVMTSNVGARSVTGGAARLGFSGGGDDRDSRVRGAVMSELRRTFRPEFLNRIDEIVVFRSLTGDDAREIARRMLAGTGRRMRELGVGLDADEEAVRLLSETGFDADCGARPLRRVIRTSVEDAVAERLLAGELKSGDTARLTVENGRLSVTK